MASDDKRLDSKAIARLLPHRYPFLLVDRVLDWERNESITAIKQVTVNEPFFQGHFPGEPVMPGVLIVEALAQAAGVLAMLSNDWDGSSGVTMYLAGISKARFKRVVTPGDTLKLEARHERTVRSISQLTCTASVDGQLACSCELLSMLEE